MLVNFVNFVNPVNDCHAETTAAIHHPALCSVFEHQDPSLKTVPLAVQQKQIVVTCNYEARRRGLRKLQLIHEAKRVCPDVVIVLGEDLTRFRDASKHLYAFLRSFSWNSRCERLGFDEVGHHTCSFPKYVTDIIDYNVSILNQNDPTNAFFCLVKHDPTVGFPYNAARLMGHLYPRTATEILETASLDPLHLRLALGSHLAHYIRSQLESEKGYTATAGVSTNKLLAKLVGSTYKPNAQTTLLPPYVGDDDITDNVTSFMDDHEVGKIPGIGFKIAQKLRAYALQRPADFDAGLVYGDTRENVLVRDIRACPGIGPETLERVLGGSGVPKGIGARVWGLLNGCDEAEVGQARDVPRQISIEDSYIRLERIEDVIKELRMLARRLLERMHTDLLEEDEDVTPSDGAALTCPVPKRWLARPKTIRLSTRPRPPQNADGSRNRSFARISKSAQMPTFVFSLKDGMDVIVNRLLNETLVPLFRKLHPEKSGWNLSLINLAATNMVDAASEIGGTGRDIGKMFKRQDAVLKQWRVEESVMKEAPQEVPERVGSEDAPTPSQEAESYIIDGWLSEDDDDMIDGDSFRCDECGAVMPTFAMGAHYRWHAS
ncbi:hypothetical protein HRS9139_00851 [Pyrenophora teres f. teres]|uniref:DNA RNA polymerase n=1 Tax=Pyrenophora teres f. teres TaxID=97479 RepID=A0A6S6VX69_9PLEO|nr:hypothetical protein HRS9139_00851 [Pyrenophora teres f. teres]KAE8868349.1 hypothetical protein PTNB29_02260 [Pyrenophora teres f. teres]CAA9959804.1 DNA/RNA polymerase [Pyrenophora teres f. maculata]CAE7023115.1 DNA RNA polymerase [Pyrenophora teres f. teres]